MNVTHDPTYREPKPKRYHAIRCLSCKSNLASKNELRSHKGHEVHYVNERGEIDE